jgi:hypothetical protein
LNPIERAVKLKFYSVRVVPSQEKPEPESQ